MSKCSHLASNMDTINLNGRLWADRVQSKQLTTARASPIRGTVYSDSSASPVEPLPELLEKDAMGSPPRERALGARSEAASTAVQFCNENRRRPRAGRRDTAAERVLVVHAPRLHVGSYTCSMLITVGELFDSSY